MYKVEIFGEVMYHDNEEWYKNWTLIDLSVQNSHEEFVGCFWPKYIMFELKRSTEELCLMGLNIGVKFE